MQPSEATVLKHVKNQAPQWAALLIATVVVGAVVGLSSALLSEFLGVVERFFLHFHESLHQPVASSVPSLRRLGAVFLGGLIAAAVWWWQRNRLRPFVGIKGALQGKTMPVGSTVVNVLTQIFYVGTGGSVGRELAPRQAGVMLAQRWEMLSQKIGLAELSDTDRKLILASAAGAGFAGVYIAPFTGMLFAVEMLLKKITVKTVSISLVMSVVAMAVGALAKGYGPYYSLADMHFSHATWILVILLGPLAGLLGGLGRRAFAWAEAYQTQGRGIFWQLPLAAGLTSLIAMAFPAIMGNGRGIVQLAIDSHPAVVGILLVGGLAKLVMTVGTIRAGAAGGTLTPAIALGAVVGVAALTLVHPWFMAVPFGQAAILGGACFLAASQQAPLMAMLMMFEITHLDYSAMMPLSLGVALATLASQLVVAPQERLRWWG
ncbi:chloride channel protein [Leuconostocaceae bacterium ESL0723]|nr:chloride channel protein [Leuconostocaceae bacterium ESL0723]